MLSSAICHKYSEARFRKERYLFHYPRNSLGIITIIILLASSVSILKTVLEFMSPAVTVSMLKRVETKELKTFILKILS
jgi:hypothetical protein